MIRCIVCDLDGTLIRHDDTMEEKTLSLLKECIDNGVEFIIATGRDIHMVRRFMKGMNLNCDLILNNGTQYRNLEGTFNEIHPMNNESFIKVATILKEYNYLLAIHTNQGKYSFHDKEDFWKYHVELLTNGFHYSTSEEELPDKTFTTRAYLEDLHYASTPADVLNDGAKVLKIDARYSGETSVDGVKALLDDENLDISSSYDDNIEITTKEYNKGIMLRKVILQKGYKEDEVATFGDGLNDVDMLESFKYSFAPDNAGEAAKKAATYNLTLTAHDGAVGEGIEMLKKMKLL